jgi:DNA-binding NtrC family response regulator
MWDLRRRKRQNTGRDGDGLGKSFDEAVDPDKDRDDHLSGDDPFFAECLLHLRAEHSRPLRTDDPPHGLGAFRRCDPRFRIGVFHLEEDRWGERTKGVEALSRYFLRIANRRFGLDVQGIEEEAIEFLQATPMPNNLRGLKKAIQATALDVRKGVIRKEDLLASLRGESLTAKELEVLCARILESYGMENASKVLVDFEKALLSQMLRRTGNLTRLARHLSISRNTLKSKLQKYGLEAKSGRRRRRL